MKTKIVKYSLLFILLPLLAFAGGKGERVEKVIHRQFSIQSNGVLSIENKYGSVDITPGPSNQIKINVTMAVEASSTKKAQEALDQIDIAFAEGQNKVSAITQVGSSSNSNSWFGSQNNNIEINYKVVVPVDIYLELKNKYGAVYVETTNKNLDINLSYGDIKLGEINADLVLDMAYSEGSISSIKNGQIKLAYSELEIDNSASVDIRIQYTDLSMGKNEGANIDASYSDFEANYIGSLVFAGKYSDVAIKNVKKIDARGSYTDIELGGLATSGTFTITYGDLEIENISAVFAEININTSYTDVSLAFQDAASFSIDAQTSYGDIKHSGLRVMEHIEKGISNTFKGSKGSGGGKVLVKMSYGDLEIE